MNLKKLTVVKVASGQQESDLMAINVYSVSNALDEVGWRLVSTTYKNLDTELEMECPKGHI